MKIAIPLWQNRVAPVLDWSSALKIYNLEGEKITGEELIDISGMSLAQRLKIIHSQKVKMVICNGVSFFCKACLLINSVEVVSNISGNEQLVLQKYRHLIAQNKQ